MALFIEAVTLAGCRAIIQTSSLKYPTKSRMESIYFMGQHPHQPVFEKCAAVVHHGGAGTSHAATRAGCPSVVVPFMNEQLFWAKQLQALGLAGRPLPAKKVTAVALAKGIRVVLNSKEMANTAKQSGSVIQKNQGVAQAITLLESCISLD